MLRLTRKQIEAGRSSKGGWKREQLRKWGVPWPPPQGWRYALEHGEAIPALREAPRSRRSASTTDIHLPSSHPGGKLSGIRTALSGGDAIQPEPQDKEKRKRELREYLGKLAYRRLDLQLRREGRHPWELTESEIYSFKLRDDAATAEMLSMRRLYEEKSRRT